ncbi:hypothetical protein JHD49_02135 [Sulfurimonas sp. SAG-AH-194-C21]|nr:hypothetical protein [Sulfurimonas sp. SAG-AH-194-C21]MDF1882730.1 hypothetical protein [Sulfurimonas sp. SAG-AH-194-C21]
MSVVFEATIKVNIDKKNWHIELRDTVDDRMVKCLTFELFEEKLEELGQDYGGNIDEVRWMKDEDVSPHMMDELRMKMAEAKARIEESTGEAIET